MILPGERRPQHSFRLRPLFQQHRCRVQAADVFNPAPGISLNFGRRLGIRQWPQPASASEDECRRTLRAGTTSPRLLGGHTLRFGVAVNRISNLISAHLFGLAPQVGSDTGLAVDRVRCSCGPFAGGASNPLNYPVDSITLGNGFNCFSENSGRGSPCGGFSDTRMQAYVGDTLEGSLQHDRYHRSAIRSRYRTSISDLPAIPCSAVAASYGLRPLALAAIFCRITSGEFPVSADRMRQPNLNFAPQFGLAWDPGKSGRSVVRAGIGMYYDNNVFRTVLPIP